MKKYFWSIALVIFLGLVVSGLLLFKTEERTQLKMHTFVKITLHGPRWMNFDETFNKAFSAVGKIDAIANMYNPDSELSVLNRGAHIKPMPVSDDMFALLKDSIDLSQDSEGAFDITVAPLVRLWKDYQKNGVAPTDDDIKKTLALVGYMNIELDQAHQSVFFKKEGVALDLSAIAEGFAVDKAIEEIRRCGFKSAIVNVGGELYCLGRKYFFKKWNIGIADPRNEKDIIEILYLADEAVATSGGYEQYFSCQGKEYTHIIDTATGYPKQVRYTSVTVIAPSCTLADGMATAVLAGGEGVKSRLKQLYPGIDIIIKS